MKQFLCVAAICLIATPMIAIADPAVFPVMQATKAESAVYSMTDQQPVQGDVRAGAQIWLNPGAPYYINITGRNWLDMDWGDIDPANNTSRQLANNRFYLIDAFLMSYATDATANGPGSALGTVAWYGGYATGWHLGTNPQPLPDPNTEGQYFLAAFGLNLPGSQFGPTYYLPQGWNITYTLYDPNDPNNDFRFWIFGPDFYNGITDPNDPNFNNDPYPGLDFGYGTWFGAQPTGTRVGPSLGLRDDVNAPGAETIWTVYEGNDPWVDPNNWFDDHWYFVSIYWFGDPNYGYPFAQFEHGLWGDAYVVGCPTPGNHGAYCTADIDGSGDCIVNLSDLSVLLGAYGATSPDPRYNPDADFDGNLTVNLGDLSVLLGQYGDNCN